MESTQNHKHILPLVCAALASTIAFTWQFLNVRYNYGGNWTGLFCIGDNSTVPPLLSQETLYRFPKSSGYDGQFYYYIAQDPFLKGDSLEYVDNPPLRWRRILVPALAHILALGRKDLVARAYVGIVLASVFLGTWWLSRFLQNLGYCAFWGLCFLMIPGVAVSLDRMTVDILLVALCIAFSFYGIFSPGRCEKIGDSPARPKNLSMNAGFLRGALGLSPIFSHLSSWKICPVLLLAPLVRETGLILPMAFSLFCLLGKRRKEAALGMAMAIPWLAWALYLRIVLWSDGTPWLTAIPFKGLAKRFLDPVPFEITGRWFAIAAVLDYVALLGVCLAFFIAVTLVWRKNFGLLELTTIVFTLSAMWVSKADVWGDAYAFARTMSPVLVWTALLAALTRQWWMLLPLALTIPRIGQQIVTVSLPIIRGLVG